MQRDDEDVHDAGNVVNARDGDADGTVPLMWQLSLLFA